MMEMIIYGFIGGVAFFAVVTYFLLAISRKKEEEKKRLFLEAYYKEALEKKRELLLEAKEEIQRKKSEIETEIKEKKIELSKLERRVIQKEESVDKRIENIERKERSIQDRETYLNRLERDLKDSLEKEKVVLYKLSNLSEGEAKSLLLTKIESDLTEEIGIKVKEATKIIEEESKTKAQYILATAIQRCALDHTAETTVTTVSLPNDEIKGRLIGREGRNIRAFETLTGVDLIVDDTPEAVVLSSFDPIRREIARISLERLINDGRIHPGRIEEMIEKAKKEVDEKIKVEGEKAVLQTGTRGIKPEIVKTLGRLFFRTSYGQNVLQHSIEVAQLSAALATELKLDVNIARRAGLLHDLGKAIDHEEEGTHALLGAKLLERYGENPDVIHAVAAHHEDEEMRTIYPIIVQVSDSISAVRPGARRENLEVYVKRLESLEKIADSIQGVEKAFAVQAGREVRVIVKPDKITDNQAAKVAHDIAQRIEKEVAYPGLIKVTVIRETRVVDYAK